jgi:hypothetical protein
LYIAPPKNVDVPSKMKVKRYMYPQVKKTCGDADFYYPSISGTERGHLNRVK